MIEKEVLFYLENHKINYEPDHPTNTCDAYTGNWFERMMNPFELKLKFKKIFKTKIIVYNGYYFSILRNKNYLPKLVLNIVMFILPIKLSLIFSPYYVISGNDRKV